MAQGSQNSWKDEWLVGLFSIPLILSFCGEQGRTIVTEGFAALQTMPELYQYTLGVIVTASFGVRSATKFFGKKQGMTRGMTKVCNLLNYIQNNGGEGAN